MKNRTTSEIREISAQNPALLRLELDARILASLRTVARAVIRDEPDEWSEDVVEDLTRFLDEVSGKQVQTTLPRTEAETLLVLLDAGPTSNDAMRTAEVFEVTARAITRRVVALHMVDAVDGRDAAVRYAVNYFLNVETT